MKLGADPPFQNRSWATNWTGWNGASSCNSSLKDFGNPILFSHRSTNFSRSFLASTYRIPLSFLAFCRHVFCYASDDPSHAGGSGAGEPRSSAHRGHDLRPDRLPSCPQLEVLGADENRQESWSG